ncbi:MAG TPA: hypothetical protein VLY03_00065 [Bacteroidota bacterium]|nr:hypothetical protein [Bacteroidota bacterium]
MFIAVFTDCHSARNAQSAGGADSVIAGSRRVSSGTQPNVFQQSVSLVEAVVDTVIVTDSLSYRASVLVRSASGKGNTFASEGEHLTIVPQYGLTDSMTVDPAAPRNKGLLRLRTMKKGESFRGKLSLGQDGGWRLLEVQDQ